MSVIFLFVDFFWELSQKGPILKELAEIEQTNIRIREICGSPVVFDPFRFRTNDQSERSQHARLQLENCNQQIPFLEPETNQFWGLNSF